MSETPYIWLLWQTDTGKVLICLFLGIVLTGTFIQMFGWWLVPIVIGFVLLLWLSLRLDRRKKKADYPKGAFPSDDDVNNNLAYESLPAKFWLVIGKTGERPIEYDNRTFWIKFAIDSDFRGVRVDIVNTSDQNIEIVWKSATINSERVYIDWIIYSKYPQESTLAPGESASRLLIPYKNFVNGKFIRLFLVGEMMKREVRCDLTIDIKDDNNQTRTFVYNLYTQCKKTS